MLNLANQSIALCKGCCIYRHLGEDPSPPIAAGAPDSLDKLNIVVLISSLGDNHLLLTICFENVFKTWTASQTSCSRASSSSVDLETKKVCADDEEEEYF